ncbi:NADPH-dependent FMN reductase [Nocardia sp. NPDC047038]|uniref:NADPH-dependent FMN reductase n=1 Tax=Nocardia sp. NPDC047038 TaxID=3154338 RepID=UPI0033C91271
MSTYTVGYIIGSLSRESANRILSKALIRLASTPLSFTEIPIKDLPLYNHDYDVDYPPEGRALKAAIAAVDAVLLVTPEYNRSIPGALKNAIDWASRPWGDNSFALKPSAVIGASPGKLGTALAQLSLRSVLGYCNPPQMKIPRRPTSSSTRTSSPLMAMSSTTRRSDFSPGSWRILPLSSPACTAWSPNSADPICPDSPSPERRRSGHEFACPVQPDGAVGPALENGQLRYRSAVSTVAAVVSVTMV